MNSKILNLAVAQLQNKVELIMFDINGMLSSGFSEGIVQKVADKISELSLANLALEQGLGLRLQMLQMEAEALTKDIEPDLNKDIEPDLNKDKA